MLEFDSVELHRLFALLNEELQKEDVEGEIYLVGGAVMCLVFAARGSTRDVDAFFQPSQKIREAAAKIALKLGIRQDWLNDSVKAYLSPYGQFETFLEFEKLRVLTCQADYLLAMKCLAMRIGEEFHDLADIRYLLRYLNITTYEEALTVITRYYPLKAFPQKTLYALEELINS